MPKFYLIFLFSHLFHYFLIHIDYSFDLKILLSFIHTNFYLALITPLIYYLNLHFTKLFFVFIIPIHPKYLLIFNRIFFLYLLLFLLKVIDRIFHIKFNFIFFFRFLFLLIIAFHVLFLIY